MKILFNRSWNYKKSLKTQVTLHSLLMTVTSSGWLYPLDSHRFHIHRHNGTLGINMSLAVLLVRALFTNMLSFGGGCTNVLQGIILLVIFAVYLFTTIVP